MYNDADPYSDDLDNPIYQASHRERIDEVFSTFMTAKEESRILESRIPDLNFDKNFGQPSVSSEYGSLSLPRLIGLVAQGPNILSTQGKHAQSRTSTLGRGDPSTFG